MLEQDTLSDIDLMLPNDQLEDEITKQIDLTESIHTFNKNFLTVFHQRQLLKDENRESEEDENEGEAVEVNASDTEWLYRNVILQMREISGILIDTDSSTFDPNVINSIYSMLVYRLHVNMIVYLTITIIHDKEVFYRTWLPEIKNSISLKSAKKTFRNKYDALIAVKYSDIIAAILQDENYMNPETFIEVLYNFNRDDYEYVTIINLFKLNYLSFDIPKFISHIQHAYSDNLALDNLKGQVIQRLIPSFPIREVEEIEEDTE